MHATLMTAAGIGLAAVTGWWWLVPVWAVSGMVTGWCLSDDEGD